MEGKHRRKQSFVDVEMENLVRNAFFHESWDLKAESEKSVLNLLVYV